jgi:uncharacterized protein YkwD
MLTPHFLRFDHSADPSHKKRTGSLSDFEDVDPHKIGLEALRLSNEFRAKHSKPPLKWHQALADIGLVHSKNMGDGKVPFSHTGSDARFKAYADSLRKLLSSDLFAKCLCV